MVGALCLATFVSGSAIADDRLSCEGNSFNEKKMLLQAPNGAKRISRHVLEVKFATGVKRFTDKSPHEELSGEHWIYCGYNENAGMHLIGVQIEGLFSGKLLLEKTGQILDAGHTIILSPDRQLFFSIEQQDGMDGENWALYDTKGKKLWGGYAGVLDRLPGNGYDSVCAQFENPHFSSNMTVEAQLSCESCSPGRSVTLQRSNGEWMWDPLVRCDK